MREVSRGEWTRTLPQIVHQSHPGGVINLPLGRIRLCVTDDGIDFARGRDEVPALQLHQQIEPVTRTALVADVGAVAALVVPTIAIVTTAQGARTVPIRKKGLIHPELAKDPFPFASRGINRPAPHDALPRLLA